MQESKNLLGNICEILLIAGGINWGSIALINVNLVNALFASLPIIEKSIYGLVGLSGLCVLYRLIRINFLSRNHINSAF